MNSKQFLFLLASIGVLASCGSTPAGSSSAAPSGDSSEAPSSSINPNVYSVTAKYDDGTPVSGGAYAQWCTERVCQRPVVLDANGYAEANIKDDNYIVHINDLPAGDVYNPNIYTASADHKHNDITVYHSASLQGGGTEYDRYMVESGKVYNVQIKKSSSTVFLGFDPKEPGSYQIESWATAIQAEVAIDPKVGYYGASSAFLNLQDSDDNSGVGDNFLYQIDVGESAFVRDGNGELERDSDGNLVPGASYSFGISAEAGLTDYPVTFPVKITRVGDYSDPVQQREMVQPAETLVDQPDVAEGLGWTRGKLLEGEESVVYNETDRFYHVGTKDGPVLHARLTKECEFLDLGVAYLWTGGTNPYITDGGEKDYWDFVDAYASHVNDDGAYPVTEELKVFLDKFQYCQQYFAHGGWIASQLSNHFQEGNEWMFACGYYRALDGSEDFPFTVDELGATIVELAPSKESYVQIILPGVDQVELVITNEGVTFIDPEGVETACGADFDKVLTLENGKITFRLRNETDAKKSIGLRVLAIEEE